MHKVTKVVRDPIVHYAHARKRMHYAMGFAIFLIEIAATMLVHDLFIHASLNTMVFSWEALVVKLGESEL